MKLYNKTKCPTELLRPLLLAAGKSVKADTGGVAVQVNPGRCGWLKGARGSAVKCDFVRIGKRWLQTNGGRIRLTLPGMINSCYVDSLSLVEGFYQTAQHEWAHIKDYQAGTFVRSPQSKSGHRIRWAKRPCEQYANAQVMFAKKVNVDDLLIDLAIWIEDEHKRIWERG